MTKNSSPLAYVAFLRGINVGGHKIISMEELGGIFRSLKFDDVKTFIASGNVLFRSRERNVSVLTRKIEKGLLHALGYEVKTMLRTIPELQNLVKLDPFKKIKPVPDVGLYVTFLSKEPEKTPKLPYISPKRDFEILRMYGLNVASISRLLPNGRSGNPGGYIEKEFEKISTTRNWNTVKKIVEMGT